jgi:hypothetical protein
MAARFPSPSFALNSDRESLHVMHQHPPHAPRGPKSSSKSFQVSGVSGFQFGARVMID